MSDKNGDVNRIKDIAGGQSLEAHMVKSRLEEILGAGLAKPLPEYPPIAEMLVYQHTGPISSIKPAQVIGALDRARWKIRGVLSSFGLDVNDGEFTVKPVDAGILESGAIGCRFVLEWDPREAKEVKPTLTAVP